MANSKIPGMPVVKSQSAQPTTHGKAIAKRLTSTHAHNGNVSTTHGHGGNMLSLAAAKALLARHNGGAEHAGNAGQLVAPGLTRGQLARDTAAATRLKFGPAEQALTQQIQQNKLQGARSNDWYAQYQQAIQDAATRQAQTQQGAVQDVTQLQQGLNTAAQQDWAGQQTAMQADAARRGASTDPALANDAHNASNVRNALLGSYGAMLLSQGAAQQKGFNDRVGTAGQQGLEAGQLNAQKFAGLLSERGQLAQQKGDFKTTYQQTEKSNAQDAALKAALTQSQIGTANANMVQSYASANASNATAGKTKAITAFVQKYGYVPSGQPSQLEQAKLDYFNKHGYFPRTGPPPKPKGGSTPKAGQPATGPGSLSRSQENKVVSQISSAAGFYQNPPVVNGKPLTAAQITASLLNGTSPLKVALDPHAVNVARSLAGNGGDTLGPWGLKNAHQLGIHVGGRWKVTKARPASGGNPGRVGV